MATWWDDNVAASAAEGFEPVEGGGVRGRLRQYAAVADARSYNDPVEDPYLRRELALVQCPAHLITAPEGLPINPEQCSPPIMAATTVEDFQKALPQLTVEEAPGTNHFTVCIGRESNTHVVRATHHALQ